MEPEKIRKESARSRRAGEHHGCNRNEPSVQESSQHGYSQVRKRTGGQERVRDESEIPPGQGTESYSKKFLEVL